MTGQLQTDASVAYFCMEVGLADLNLPTYAGRLGILGPFLGVQLPLTVIQRLWVNLIMDTFTALALSTEPPDNTVKSQPPRSPNAFIITPKVGS